MAGLSNLSNHSSHGRRVIVTIGIDRYTAWPRLCNAVNDARNTSEIFDSLGFDATHALIDEAATGAAIRSFASDGLSTLGVNDSLIVFFAGHGGSKTQAVGGGPPITTGYIIPVDAENQRGEVATWIRLDTWLAEIARLPPNHILVILDACHSGIALVPLVRTRDASAAHSSPTSELSRRRSRKLIVSALDDQLALDGGPRDGHSLFTGCLIEALTNDFRREGRGYVTGSELGLHLQRQVREYPNSRQMPAFGAFELDERGELVIELSPLRTSTKRELPVLDSDSNAALRRSLASALSSVISDPATIANVVAATAPTLQAARLPDGPATTQWLYVLVELTNASAHAEISAIISAARRHSRRSERIDWARYTPLLLASTSPTVASWSHLTLSLGHNTAGVDRSGTALITHNDTLLESFVTLCWGGIQPPTPTIKVTSYQLFGRTMPLLHAATAVTSRDPNTASWRAKIPIPRARIRTRRVKVQCVGTHLAETRYVVPKIGSVFAAAVWIMFAAWMWSWLEPFRYLLITAPLSAFSALSISWISISMYLPRRSRGYHLFSSIFFAWELAVIFATLLTILIVIIPPRIVTSVSNTTEKNIQIGRVTIPSFGSKLIYFRDLREWEPEPPFCRCNDESDCQKCKLPRPHYHTNDIMIGCFEHNCDHIVQRYQRSGKATIIRPVGSLSTSRLSELTFEHDTTTPRMTIVMDDKTATVEEIEPPSSGSMILPILPSPSSESSTSSGRFSIEFATQGSLICPNEARRIVALDISPPLPAKSINITLGNVISRWTSATELKSVRACTNSSADEAVTLKLEIEPEGDLTCSGQQVNRIISFDASISAASTHPIRLKIGNVESTWTATTGSTKRIRACLGSPGDIELPRLAPGDRIVIPRFLTTIPSTQILIEKPRRILGRRPDDSTIEVTGCRPGDTVRAVRVVGAVNDRLQSLVKQLAVPLDLAAALTCRPEDRQSVESKSDHCELIRNELTCWIEYIGECRIRTNRVIEPGGQSDACQQPAIVDSKYLKMYEYQHHLHCNNIYQCEF
jgi:hypothetical protein